MEYPNTRAEAKAIGATHYFTGKPCTRGHIALRKTKGSCVECMREDWATDNAKRAEKPKSEAAKAAARRYYEKNRKAVIARAASRPSSEVRQYKDKHKQNNPEYYKALTSVRKRRHRSATPKWITKEQKVEMRKLYLDAQRLTKITGERYVVDHIIPLINPEVCGLHVPWNLRVMTQEENLRKSNKLLDTPNKQEYKGTIPGSPVCLTSPG
jgi:5-methylcytosine-specific restriction endonuclease McrA